jgi:hypothetical protein
MIKLENVEISGWEAAIRGMRNPMNSWDKSDSAFYHDDGDYHDIHGNLGVGPTGLYLPIVELGPNDLDLAKRLSDGGPVHGKFKRMIVVTLDITAPLYWWKEFDTYKVGTVANSCSTMHKIHAKEFEFEDFSFEHLIGVGDLPEPLDNCLVSEIGFDKHPIVKIREGVPMIMLSRNNPDDLATPKGILCLMIDMLNRCRSLYLETKDKRYWWQMIQLLPTSYNQKRTVMLNYEVLTNIYHYRKDHKLDEWHDFCHMIEDLPYAKELIIGKENKHESV